MTDCATNAKILSDVALTMVRDSDPNTASLDMHGLSVVLDGLVTRIDVCVGADGHGDCGGPTKAGSLSSGGLVLASPIELPLACSPLSLSQQSLTMRSKRKHFVKQGAGRPVLKRTNAHCGDGKGILEYDLVYVDGTFSPDVNENSMNGDGQATIVTSNTTNRAVVPPCFSFFGASF